jgi:hypothetical protein
MTWATRITLAASSLVVGLGASTTKPARADTDCKDTIICGCSETAKCEKIDCVTDKCITTSAPACFPSLKGWQCKD